MLQTAFVYEPFLPLQIAYQIIPIRILTLCQAARKVESILTKILEADQYKGLNNNKCFNPAMRIIGVI